MRYSSGNLTSVKKENVILSEEIRTEMKKHARREQYLYERDKNRVIQFNDEVCADSKSIIEDVINTRNLHIALKQSLDKLSDNEKQIIFEVFFESSAEPNYTKLAERHGVSRQCFTRKLNRILAKLKVLINNCYIEF